MADIKTHQSTVSATQPVYCAACRTVVRSMAAHVTTAQHKYELANPRRVLR